MQATFDDACGSQVILGSDLNSEAWADIVKITKHFGNYNRLAWDIFHISHHCSYTALSSEKGKSETTPNNEVKWLFETMGKNRSRIISPSWSISDEDTIQPPHKQAAAYYKKVAADKTGEFKVTMDHPKKSQPEPIIFIIDKVSCTRLYLKAAAATFAYEHKLSRAGYGK